MNGSILEVIVVGAGHAGLITSYYLKHLGLDHIIFEKGRIGESWRSQRWSNFRMITPDRLNVLQGSTAKLRTPDQYSSAPAFVNHLKDYVSAFQLPVSENCTVLSIEKAPGAPVFSVTVSHDNDMVRKYDCWQVIVASGAMNCKHFPSFAKSVASTINQLHSSEYKGSSDLPPGGILVVGGGQSGCEIANDLADAERKVYLSTAGTPAMPRLYRGKDMMDWLMLSRQFDSRLDEMDTGVAPVISTDPDLPLLDLNYLAGKGVTLLGPLIDISQNRLSFKPGINDLIQEGQHYGHSVVALIDELILGQQINSVPDAPERVNAPRLTVPELLEVDLRASDISTIVWATGHTSNFDFVKFPVFNNEGKIDHREGLTSVDGLYFIGLPTQRTRQSGFIFNLKEDASFVANKAYSALR